MTRNKSCSFFYTLWTSSETQNKQSSRMWRETKAALSSTHCDRVLETQNKQSYRILRETNADLSSTHCDHLLETQNKCNIKEFDTTDKNFAARQQQRREREREKERVKDEMQKNCVVRRIHTYRQACMQKRRKKAKNQTKKKINSCTGLASYKDIDGRRRWRFQVFDATRQCFSSYHHLLLLLLDLVLSLSIFSLVRPSPCLFSCSSSYFSWILVSPSPKFLLPSTCFRLCACVCVSLCVEMNNAGICEVQKCSRDSWAQRPKYRAPTAPEAD
jgi:hypothetical protein